MVEEIEELNADLRSDTLGNRCVLEDREIRVEDGWSFEGVASEIPEEDN